jgi:hypothetical protein
MIRTSQRMPDRYLSMCLWGDTMHGVHITIEWRATMDRKKKKEEVVWVWTKDEMVQKLRIRLERHLR